MFSFSYSIVYFQVSIYLSLEETQHYHHDNSESERRHITALGNDDRIRRTRVNDTNQLYDRCDFSYASSFVRHGTYVCINNETSFNHLRDAIIRREFLTGERKGGIWNEVITAVLAYNDFI